MNRIRKYMSAAAILVACWPMAADSTVSKDDIINLTQYMAAVRINGKTFPVMWKAPFLLDITPALHKGDNTIEIDVTNLWPNRMIGDEREPDDIEWSEPFHYSYAPGNPVAGRFMKSIPDWLRNGTPRPSKSRKTVGCFKSSVKASIIRQ